MPKLTRAIALPIHKARRERLTVTTMLNELGYSAVAFGLAPEAIAAGLAAFAAMPICND